jgi:hypothetical protein
MNMVQEIHKAAQDAPSISSSALLVSFKVTLPTFRRKDKKATKEVTQNNGADRKVVNVTKALLGECEEYRLLNTHVGDTRNNSYYARTLPWHDKGARFLTTVAHFDFHEDMTDKISTGYKLWDKFLNVYEYQRDVLAKQSLGALWNPEEYPTLSDLRDNGFKMWLAYDVIPDAGDIRVDLPAQALEYVTSQVQQGNDARLNAAMSDLWHQLHYQIQAFIKNLSSDETTGKRGKISEGVFERLVDLTDMLHSCNVTNDPQMDAMRRKLSAAIGGVSTDAIRNSPTIRDNTHKKLTEALNSLPSLNI